MNLEASKIPLIGIADSGIHQPAAHAPDVQARLHMAREAGVFEFVNRAPSDEDFRAVLLASERTGMPILAGTAVYMAGRDEAAFERNIVKARLLGSIVHDVQLMTSHRDGHPLSDEEVAEYFLRFSEFGTRHGVSVGFEVHVNMWSEHFGRISRVAQRVERRGVAFSLTFDPSHVVFKIDNPKEQRVQDLRRDVESGSLIIDPCQPGNVLQEWIEAGYVIHCHARAAVPGNPVNIWAKHPDGSFGRGIQYPLTAPQPGEWHSEWDGSRLAAWKSSIRTLIRWHCSRSTSRLKAITCEFIPAIDYGGGAKYSILEQNVACANWLRDEFRRLPIEYGGADCSTGDGSSQRGT